MEKIAIISDIHGNMPALDAVLEDIRHRDLKSILCLGDLVGKGPHSERAVDRIREVCHTVIMGNWDDFMSKPAEDPTLNWHQARLGTERMAYLRGLPFSYEFWMSGKYVRLFHASPRSVYERIQPWDAMDSRLSMFESSALCSETLQADVAGYGDVHNAYLQHLNGRTLFNVGSVGNPLDMPQASYAILEGHYHSKKTAPLNIQLVRVPYDIERAVQQAKDEDMPDLEPYVIELRTGQYRGKKK
ncbi:metallophosphoesterase family protein [Paenibacillus sp. SYP-B3998]|uniref:Metallophosphoesterase family protein n=1 Tax=Paenibacillus sp. SYP-B3998 TaxID=2678564 RepID=A0A6G4A207_9BACL|nr:metallophosphoesterase family protein [Paenibacillus sp. SYP-B3998]NEW07974.1 metallophosphoesterase family protein [Paenibacillus sp. SYP-B3998]